MLSFIAAGLVAVITLAIAAFVAFANGMSDAPTERGTPIWPILAVGFAVAALIIASHYVHLSW